MENYKKKIAFVLIFGEQKKDRKTTESGGGAERRLSSIFSLVDRQKIQIDILFIAKGNGNMIGTLKSRYIAGHIKTHVFPTYRKALRHIARENYELVCYTDALVKSLPLSATCRLTGRKTMIMAVTAHRSKLQFRSWIEKIVVPVNFRLAHSIDTLYPASIRILKNQYPQKRISFCPCCLPRLEVYSNLPPKENIILFASRLIPTKNVLMFARSIVKLQDEMRRRQFVAYVCGDGVEKPLLDAYIQESGCGDIIHTLGYRNMEEITPRCRIFCTFQKGEDYPSQSLQEAIASGCYCISSEGGDTHLILKDSFGKLVPHTVDALAAAIEETFSFDRQKWDEIVANAQAFAKENLRIEKAVAHFEQLFVKE